MTVVNNLKTPSAIAKVSDLIDNVCEYFEKEDEIDDGDTLIEVGERDNFVIIKIDRMYYMVIENNEDTSLRKLIESAKEVSVIPDGESITMSISIPF